MAELPQRWVVVCEHESDAVIASGLADRLALEPAECVPVWVRENLDTYRRWSGDGDDPEGRRLRWTGVKERARTLGIAPHGYGVRTAGLAGVESAELRKTIAVVTHMGTQRPAGLLLVRDTDADEKRRREYRASVAAQNAAFSASASPLRMVLALPHPEMEAWLLAGFDPVNQDERSRLDTLRRRLGKDPCERGHELNPGRTATGAGPVKNSTKNALDELCDGDRDRERACWEGASIDRLTERGQHNGLVEFFEDVRSQYVASLKSDG
jgi:hypothetical protein